MRAKYLDSNEYYKFKCMIAKFYNGENVPYPLSWVKKKIGESYANRGLQYWQYDQLMDRIQEIENF